MKIKIYENDISRVIISNVYSPIDNNVLSEKLDGKYINIIIENEITIEDAQELYKYASLYERINITISHTVPNNLSFDFLVAFPNLYGFAFSSYDYVAFDEFQKIPKCIKYLALGDFKFKKLSLLFLNNFTSLEKLLLSGKFIDFENVKILANLKNIFFDKYKFDNISIFEKLQGLEYLTIRHSAIDDLTVLSHLKSLKYLELWKIRNLSNIEWLNKLVSLQNINLGGLRVEEIPDLSALKKLRRIDLSLKNITSIKSLSKAPHIEEIILRGMNKIEMNEYKSFLKHPSLIRLTVGYTSSKKIKEIENLLGLEKVSNWNFKYF